MKAARREILASVLILLFALGAGFLIQALLYARDARAAELRANVIMSDLLTDVQAFGDGERARFAAAAERLEDLPREKRERLDALQLDLLTIVSADHPIDPDYVPVLGTVIEEYQLDERCASVCWDMMQDCRAENAGFPMICSAFRTQEYQQDLFDNKVIRVMHEKYCSVEEATALAAEEVAYPGTSEHQLGLAADIIDETFPYLTEWQETTGTQRWLKEHAADYGFILRYPTGSSDITGIIYEPWHYRYVGVKFAREITKRGITLEEYVTWRRGR